VKYTKDTASEIFTKDVPLLAPPYSTHSW